MINPRQAAFRSVTPRRLRDPLYNNAGLGQTQGAHTAQPITQLNAKSGLEAVQCYKCEKFGNYARDCAEEAPSGTVQALSEAELLQEEIANQCIGPALDPEELQGDIKRKRIRQLRELMKYPSRQRAQILPRRRGLHRPVSNAKVLTLLWILASMCRSITMQS